MSLLLGVFGLHWRTAIWILVGLGVGQMLLFASLFRNSPRQHPGVNEAEARLIEGDDRPNADSQSLRSAERMTVRQMLKTMTPRSFVNLMCLSLQSLLSTFADNLFSNWIPKFLSEVHDLEFKTMGVYSALPLLGGALAGLLGGALNDYLIAITGNRRWSRVGVAFAGKGIAAVLLLAALTSYEHPYAFCVYLFFVKLFGDCSLTTSWGVITDIGGRATASVFAWNNSIAGIGLIVAPIAFGYVADHYGWHAVFVTVAITYVLCALSWLVIDCTIPVLRADGGGRKAER
jgi:MFS family permease